MFIYWLWICKLISEKYLIKFTNWIFLQTDFGHWIEWSLFEFAQKTSSSSYDRWRANELFAPIICQSSGHAQSNVIRSLLGWAPSRRSWMASIDWKRMGKFVWFAPVSVHFRLLQFGHKGEFIKFIEFGNYFLICLF